MFGTLRDKINLKNASVWALYVYTCALLYHDDFQTEARATRHGYAICCLLTSSLYTPCTCILYMHVDVMEYSIWMKEKGVVFVSNFYVIPGFVVRVLDMEWAKVESWEIQVKIIMYKGGGFCRMHFEPPSFGIDAFKVMACLMALNGVFIAELTRKGCRARGRKLRIEGD